MHRVVLHRRWVRLATIGLVAWGALVAASAAQAAVSATDFTGHRVTLARPAERIVALTPHLVENLFTAGLGDRLVGAVRYSDYPAAAQRIPRVGGYRSVSLEAIVARRPDLVVAWAQSDTADVVRRLRGLGIAVYVDDPTDFAGIARTIRDLGRLGGTEATAETAATTFTNRMHALRSRYGKQRPVSVFYEVAMDPLITISGSSMIGAAIRLCGGANIYEDAPTAAPHIGIESLIARNPDAIVSAQPADDDKSWQRAWQQWPTLDAVARDHFVTVPRGAMSRPTVRMAEATTRLCQGLERVRRDSPNADTPDQARPSSHDAS
ncbi:cobalamin-binding protein [Salinisphaera sp. Q1T1-3]|uniref:cobalamin-binding protein n=1 Tax=Salinisphaera sp. Q1T1-3 TaxID=2321229 RepID=UPI00131473E9|nr:cobalamin-binding protein [Salinisphaera sp. Q1T1-3]